MKLKINEEVILLFSVTKWLLIATFIGALVGLAASGFITLIHFVIDQSNHYEYAFYFLPLSFFTASLLSLFVLKNNLGTNQLIAAINKNYGRVAGSFIPTKVINVILILATGGSAGKESPCAQIGAGLASLCANLLRVDDVDRKKMVICGFSAGFACVFGTPLAGALFGIEVLAVGMLLYDVLLPTFVASITAFQISSALGITFFRYPLHFVPDFKESFFFRLFLAGIFFGFCAYGFIRALKAGEQLTARLNLWRPLQGALGGLLLVMLTLLFSREYLGLGLDRMESCLKGAPVVWYAFLLKAVFTVITLIISRSGSVITPIFFIGATAGSFFADVFGVDRVTFAAIGFVSILAGTTNTPIATSIMAIEMFGSGIAPYAAVSCVISFLMSGHQSLYASQVLTLTKSRAIVTEVGQELNQTTVEVELTQGSLALRLYRRIRRWRRGLTKWISGRTR